MVDPGTIIAVIQIADRLIGLCKFYVKTVIDAPADLRAILVEISILKTILETLQFLVTANRSQSSIFDRLSVPDGPIEHCHELLLELEKLFPSGIDYTADSNRSKRRRVNVHRVALAWPLKKAKADKLLDGIVRCKATINIALTTESAQDIKDIKAKTARMHEILTDSQRHELYRWFQTTDPSPLHNDRRKQYEAGTGDWMLQSPEWTDWLNRKQKCVWIHGIPGAGKTVLASYLIEKVEEHCRHAWQGMCAYVYYYCYFGHNQNEATPFLRWLITRLCRQQQQQEAIPNSVYGLFRRGLEPSLSELLSAVEACMDNWETVYVVIDAVDESQDRDELLKVLQDLATDPRFSKIQLLSTSREYVDIEGVLGEFSISVSMSNPLVTEDIRCYVQSALKKNPKFGRWPQELLEEVEEELPNKAKGMFRWAFCQIDCLQRLRPETDIIKNALANLPKTLDETYERIFSSIPQDEWPFVREILRWIYYHNDMYGQNIPCSTLLAAVERSSHEFDTYLVDHILDEESLKELCGCLISISTDTPFHTHSAAKTTVVSFAHYTVREFLNSERISRSSAAYFTLPKSPIQLNVVRTVILEALSFESYRIEDNDEVGFACYECERYECLCISKLEDFSTYCALSAIHGLHKYSQMTTSNKISQQCDLSELIFELINPSSTHFTDWAHLLAVIESRFGFFEHNNLEMIQFWNIQWILVLPTNVELLVYVLLYGDSTLARKLIEERQTEEFNDLAQIWLNFYLFMEIPIFHDNDCRSYTFDAPMINVFAQMAVSFSVQEGFKFLLEKVWKDADYAEYTALLVSSIALHGHVYTEHVCDDFCPVQLLLERGADPDGRGHRVTPLQMAVVAWDYQGVKTLLNAGANPNGVGDASGIALETGDILGRFDIVEDLCPLQICLTVDCIFENLKDGNQGDRKNIEKLLHEYGADWTDSLSTSEIE